MSEWSEIKIFELGEIITGKTPSKNNPFDWGSVMPFVTPTDYANYRKHANSSIRSLSTEGLSRLRKKILPPQSIMVTCIGSDMGKVVMNSLEVVTNQQINSIIPNKMKVNNDFLYYSIVNMHDTLRLYGGDGTAVPILNKKDFGDLVLSLPPLPEQKAIAAVLSSLDDKIDLLHRQNKTLEAMAETLFRQWFIEEAEDDWDVTKLKKYITTNENSINKGYGISHIKYLDTGSLSEGIISEIQEIELDKAPSRAKRLVQHNDILFSSVRPNQKHYGLVRHPDKNLIVSTGFVVISCKKINPYYVYYLLTSSEMIDFLHSIAEGSTSTYPSLKPSDIENLDLVLPPYEKINTFGVFCDSTWLKIESNYKKIKYLKEIRDSLLPKLMSGQVELIHG